jgi:hypothetical protein
MLHAWKLGFTHPRSGQEMTFEARVPDDFGRVMRQIPGDQARADERP